MGKITDKLKELGLENLQPREERTLKQPDSSLSISKGELQERREQTLYKSLW